MKIKLFIVLLLSLIIIGCSRKPRDYYRANKQLAKSSVSVQKSLRELAAIQYAVYPAIKMPAPVNARKMHMDQWVALDWSGPVENLLRDAARISGYSLRVLGKEPAIPALVSIHYSKKHPATIATILRDAAYQCGTKVDIVAYPQRRILELRYKTK